MLKEQILNLRKQGKSYNQIQIILNCSKGSISYYCGERQKEKNKLRTRKRRQKIHPYQNKLEDFYIENLQYYV